MAAAEPVAPAEPTPTPEPQPSWRDTLPDELKADPSLASFKDVPSLAKSFVETKKMVGAKTEGLVKVPGADAKPDEVAAFRKALGVPDAPTGYQIRRPELAAVLGWDEVAEKGFLTEAHKSGFMPQQVQVAVDFYAKLMQTQHDADRAQEKQAGLELRQEWGANYEANLGIAKRFLSQYGGDDLVEALYASRFGADARMLKAFAAAGADLMEHGAITGNGLARMDPSEADSKIREINAELDRVDPNSQRARDLVDEKYKYLAARRR